MAGDDDRLGGERRKAAQGGGERRAATAREVGASARPREESVAGQKEGNVFEEEADAAGCVAGRGENAGGEAGGG